MIDKKKIYDKMLNKQEFLNDLFIVKDIIHSKILCDKDKVINIKSHICLLINKLSNKNGNIFINIENIENKNKNKNKKG